MYLWYKLSFSYIILYLNIWIHLYDPIVNPIREATMKMNVYSVPDSAPCAPDIC